jgi:N6-adenosine-specific RNA methylase IME4
MIQWRMCSLKTESAESAGRASASRDSFPSVREWAAHGTNLGTVEFGLWAVGDWWNAGEVYGRGVRKKIVTDPSWRGPTYHTCKNAGAVARRFSQGSRYRDLGFAIHEAVAAIEPDAANTILTAAHRQHWTLARVRLEANRQRTNYHVLTGGDIVASINDLIKARRTFNAIEADPPWTFGAHTNGIRGGHSANYRKMEIDAICSLRVSQLTTDRTHLFLWTPAALLEEAFEVFRSWGFSYGRTEIIWRKTQEFGTGYRVRMEHEHLLIGVMPKSPVWLDKAIGSVVEAPRGKLHSEKPAIFHELIERAVEGPYLELFGRVRREGWTVCGDQVARS